MEPIEEDKADCSDENGTTDREGTIIEDHQKGGFKNGRGRIQSYTWILITAWTLVIVISLGWNLYQARQETQAMALTAARINFEKDLLYRRWGAIHGGVYVPVTPVTPPNPHLENVPERDLTTPSGRQLTLMNPAYMTRQVYSFSLKESAIRGHLTSLKPLRPQNLADPWEVKALKSFEQGKSEVSTIEVMEGQPYLRLMRPFKTEKGCLKCHAQQGYREGDIRGGVSVSIPLAPLYAAQRRIWFNVSLGHGFLWLVGLVGIGLGRRHMITAWQQQERTEAALRQSNNKLQDLVEDTGRLNREISLVSELADQLHACMTGEEAYQIINRMVPRLFTEHSGALFLLNASRNILEMTATWGENPPDQSMTDPQGCWALRRGRPYLMQDPERDLICEHLSPPLSSGYYCVPMVAQGETLGILHLRANAPTPDGVSHQAFSASTQSLTLTVAEHLALSLGNLKLQEALRHQAIRDPLTGLFNRRFMLETLERELYRMQRKKSSLGVIMVDLDHFKRFNDTFGHSGGDALLSALGRMLLDQVRKEDVACRYGGEEFTLILPEASLETTYERAEEVRRLVHGLNLEHHGQSLGGITISLGVASYPQHGEAPEAILQAADKALYQAKHAGRDRVVAAEKSIEQGSA
jgi:diguanylate cyclase (GGDEF)-like protein